MWRHTGRTTLVGLTVFLAWAADPAAAGDAAKDRGHALFEDKCAFCHGDRGDGRAPAADALNPRPANLRTLTKRFGTFPAAHVRAVLTGQDDAAAHSGAMAAWRALLLADANGDERKVAARVDDLLAFIKSIQLK